ncbi:MAG: NAD(P)H-quinone oxidoreductase [Alphaproteobacteria bacterium]
MPEAMPEAIPATMTAIEIRAPGGPEALTPTNRPVPEPGAGEVLVRLAAAGVNRPDVLQRQGGYPPPPGASDIPGLEIAGDVVALGPGVTELAIGDQVTALVTGGGYAEYCTAPVPQCLPIPEGLSLVEAACLPETFFTVWTNVFDRGRLRADEAFLVHGGSSGIGTTAIQMAKAFGARVFATAGSAEKCRACEELGAERAIDYRGEDFVQVVKEATGRKGVDVILDMVGGDYVQRNISALAPDGRLCYIAFLGGSKAEVDFLPVAGHLRDKVWPRIAAGEIKPVVHATFPLAEAAEAHRLMESSAHIGKIALIP